MTLLRTLLTLVLLLSYSEALAGTAFVEFLDVGQGDSILVTSPEGKTVLIDAGTGKVDVPQYLSARGIDTLNLMIATHAHADHIGGLDEVLNAVKVNVYLDNGLPHTTQSYSKLMRLVEKQSKAGLKYKKANNGQVFNLGAELKLSIIHPQDKSLRGTRSDLNSNSVVIRMQHGDNCFLFTGDAEEPSEHLLVQKGVEPCQVLKVAHHGSNHSSSQSFLNAVKPQIAVISAGYGNRYGHPGKKTLSKLERIGATIYRTDLLGTILIESDGKSLKVSHDHTVHRPGSAQITRPISIQAVEKNIVNSISIATPAVTITTPVNKGDASTVQGFNFNTANIEQLQSIPGIGPKLSQRILDYRTENGPFKSVEELVNVKGIGPSKMNNIRQHGYVVEPQAP